MSSDGAKGHQPEPDLQAQLATAKLGWQAGDCTHLPKPPWCTALTLVLHPPTIQPHPTPPCPMPNPPLPPPAPTYAVTKDA